MKKVISILSLIFLLVNQHAFSQYAEFEVTVTGKGDPVLLIPGFTCTASVWDDTVAVLSENYECHVFTLAGFGEVPAIDLPWLPKIKEGLIRYVKEKNLKKPTVIGHSLGGSLALWMASEEDNLFKKLIVVDALPSIGALMIPNFDAETIVYDNPFSTSILNMDEKSFSAMADQMASFMSLNKEKHAQLKEWILKTDRETYVHGYTDLLKLDLRVVISKIDIPVTILAATSPNKEVIIAQYEKQYQKMEQKRILYADNAAHFIMFDQPGWFLESVISELKE